MIPILYRALWYYFNAIRNYRLPIKELKRVQDKKVRGIIHYAYRYVPFYRERFRSMGLTPEDIRGVEDLRRIPTLTKREVREKYDKIIATRKDPKQAIRRLTSGSTEPALEILWDPKCCDVISGIKLRSHWMMRIRPWDKVIRIVYVGPEEEPMGKDPNRHDKDLTLFRKMIIGPWSPWLLVPRQRTLGIRRHLREIGPILLSYGPDVLVGRPSYLWRLADWFEMGGRNLRVRKIIFNSEFLSRGARNDIAKRYEAEVYDTYGSNEFGELASECSEHSGMHLYSDGFVFEFLRDGEPVASGERGKVIVTALHNEIMPLIRYEIGDIAVLRDDGCSCGSCFPRVQAIEGRENDGLALKNGTKIPPGVIIDHIESVIGIKRYQVIQEDYREVLIRLTSTNASLKTQKALSLYLKELLGEDLVIRIEIGVEESFRVKYRPIFTKVA